jgi:hypothetical protein
MRVITATLFVFAAAWVSGCASHPEPIIDMKGVDQEQFVQDWNECAAYADEVQVSKGVAKGAGLGAVIGAATGAIGGNSKDVAQGAAYGGLLGGTDSGLEGDREKQWVFKRCMSGRGYRVLN